MLTKSDIVALRNDLDNETQEVFGARFGVTQSAVALWEKNGPPKRGLVAKALIKLRARTPAKERTAA